jgi:KDO2-lipid IV(A) lauroyltransferase
LTVILFTNSPSELVTCTAFRPSGSKVRGNDPEARFEIHYFDSMKAIVFYLTWPFLYLTASLPFGLLYGMSDFLYSILTLSGYRRTVVIRNLSNAFPEKSALEIKSIASEYYRYLCDVVVESLKATKMSEQESKMRCRFRAADWLDRLYKEQRSIILVTGHYGNWEWGSACFALNTEFKLGVIYRPLANKHFDKLVARMRGRFGTKIIPQTRTLREMAADRQVVTATAFVADQSAPRDHAYWTTFLNQDTSIYTGPEKLAIKFNYPVVYVNTYRMRRGYYELVPELLCANPSETREGEISEAFARRLEKDIVASPVTWLWSHKRWKHQRPDTRKAPGIVSPQT